MLVGIKIKKWRELRNLTQEYMAQELGMSQKNYSKLENGGVSCSVERLLQISKIFELEPQDILNLDDRQTVFHSNNHQAINNQIGKKIVNNDLLLTQLQNQYEARINDLQNEIQRLHQIIEKLMSEQKIV